MATMVPLRSSKDFELLKAKGRRLSPTPWLVLQWKPNTTGEIRLGCTLPRYVGGAVVRNRIRRWCREHVRKWSAPVSDDHSLDINIFFRRQGSEFYPKLKHQDLDLHLQKGLERIKPNAR